MRSFEQFCGKDVSSRIILLTTMWDHTPASVGEFRENEIMQKYWQRMISDGSRIARFDGSAKSIWEAIDSIVMSSRKSPTSSDGDPGTDGKGPNGELVIVYATSSLYGGILTICHTESLDRQEQGRVRWVACLSVSWYDEC